jgi:hypothetical protein
LNVHDDSVAFDMVLVINVKLDKGIGNVGGHITPVMRIDSIIAVGLAASSHSV